MTSTRHAFASASQGSDPQERRLHVDVEVDRLIALGATKVTSFDDPKGVWTVIRDPEGNEFCVH